VRPSVLNPLFSPVSALPGVGPKLAKLLTGLLARPDAPGEARVIDLLFHRPTGLVDRRQMPKVAEARPGTTVTLRVTIDEHRPPRPGNRRSPYRVFAHDDTGALLLVYFNAAHARLDQLLPPGAERYVSGRIEAYGDMPQMVHPDHVVSPEDLASLPLLESVYPLTAGLTSRGLAKAERAALERVPALPEWQDAEHRRHRGWPSFGEALRALHGPADGSDLEPTSPARLRLAYDELLADQLALALLRRLVRRPRGRSIVGDGRLRERIHTNKIAFPE